jgi:putative oxidoreductase
MKWLDNKDLGILIFRIGIGAMFLFHGFPKITGGVEKWADLGESMSHLGISFAPVFWGFCAAIAEFGGGLLLITGIFFRPAIAGLLITMGVAAWMKFSTGGAFKDFAWPLEMAIIMLSFLFIGPGKYGLKIGLK